jgi:hypothetical protein
MRVRGQWKFIVALALFLTVAGVASAQKSKDVYVDKEGVMRWGDTKKEVYGFGINYTAPFAHAYRTAKKLDVDLERAIEADVYHFARLGFDAFRIHVWDTEISDSVGNLLDNEHLRLFDFMLVRMKERGMKIFLTPIAFWGNGYPERDDKMPGFAAKYGKDACLTNPDAIKAQENYLYQFLNHVNPYTKVAYKDDPDIVGFEVSNEPHHRGTPAEVIDYINRMVTSMRKTGCKKPILYNISHSIQLSADYFKAKIDGGTFQWYPTGLGARHELRGNFLPNVDRYTIPFANESGFKKGAKLVYEFDAADVGRSYIYPAIARSFREAGIQWATHFAYDPTFMAFANTEYNTHYMNLVYAPQKALSLKLAGEVFHHVPRYKKYGTYPANTKFENFRVSYEEDLAEMVTDKKFIYTNNTNTVPVNASALEEIAGAGNSAVVKYEGTGAYFLDRVQPGVWRLEVLPDAIWVDNVFGRNSLSKTVAVINYRSWPIEVTLPDLGADFQVSKLDGGSNVAVAAQKFTVEPGVYLLTKPGASTPVANSKFKNITLNEYAAPKSNLDRTYILHTPKPQMTAGKPLVIDARVVTKEEPQRVTLFVPSNWQFKPVEMTRISGYDYRAEIPADLVKEGFLNYHIAVTTGTTTETFPGAAKGTPSQWDFTGTPYKVAVVSAGMPLYLFNANTDTEELSREWRRGSTLVPAAEPGKSRLVVEVEKLFTPDPENTKGQVIRDYSMRYNFTPQVAGRAGELDTFNKLVFRGQSIGMELPLQIAFIDKAGNTFGGQIMLKEDQGEYVLNLADLKPVRQAILPRPYPTFLPYFFDTPGSAILNKTTLETLQISLGPGLDNREGPYRFEIESVRLER